MAEIARPAPLPIPRVALARARVLAARFRVARWLIAIAVAIAVASWTVSTTGDAARERERWGASVEVWVATGAVEAGSVIGGRDVVARVLPVAAVPEAALAAEESLVGHRAHTALSPGEVLVSGRVAPGAGSAAAARLPAITPISIAKRVTSSSVCSDVP